ncbi:hypothetical protein P0D84_30505 [Paraburkholderia sp. RL17-337-BIB-A]
MGTWPLCVGAGTLAAGARRLSLGAGALGAARPELALGRRTLGLNVVRRGVPFRFVACFANRPDR